MRSSLLIVGFLAALGILVFLGSASILRKGTASVPVAGMSPDTAPQPLASRENTLRIGIIPERDLFQQRKAYQALAAYLQKNTLLRVELVTPSSYLGILQDFGDGHIDAAFSGSLVSLLAIDRYDAQVLLKSESLRPGGEVRSTYCGVVFVPIDSPIRSLEDLAGKKVAGVRTTLGGAVFPIYLQQNASPGQAFDLIWSGTHEDVIREVVAGQVEAGAVKDTRLDAYEREHPGTRFRRLAQSTSAPDNALLVRPNLDAPRRQALIAALTGLQSDPAGRAVLGELGIRRFIPCKTDEYAPLRDMIDKLGPGWSKLNIEGPAPALRKPATRPANTVSSAAPRGGLQHP